MNLDRIQQLENFLREEPNDPFTCYALALEYLAGDPEKASKLFDNLLKKHPDYLGAYYQAAALYTALDLSEKAEKTYLKGIEIAAEQNDEHALRELKTAYMNFKFEG